VILSKLSEARRNRQKLRRLETKRNYYFSALSSSPSFAILYAPLQASASDKIKLENRNHCVANFTNLILMTAQTASTEQRVLRREVVGSRRFSNYWLAVIVTIGATGFLLASASSYLHVNLLPFADPIQLVFVPQGLAMGFYGTIGALFALYLWGTIALNVGGGYNEFNKNSGNITIFRWGFLGKNRRIELVCKTEEIQAVRVELREGINPKRALYLKVKGKRDVPLTPVGQPMPLSELENQGAELARFLAIPLEGL
jgi:Ycf4